MKKLFPLTLGLLITGQPFGFVALLGAMSLAGMMIKNGIVLLDCTNPYDVKIITEFTENLTGGVHNLFIYQDHVYALSAGQRFDVINIEDPANPD